MKDFIEKIKKIGFEEVFKDRQYKYGLWRIDITETEIKPGKRWHLTYRDGNPDPLKEVGVSHVSIPFYDRAILKKYFTTEIRELRLNEIGI